MRITADFSAARPRFTFPLVAALWLSALALMAVAAWLAVDVLEMHAERPRLESRLARVEEQLAAAQGDAEAECNLATLYLAGIGAPQNYEEALGWYQKAADKGYVKAQHNLGALYGSGRGAPKDLVRAYKWLLLAQQGGFKDDSQALDQLRSQMKPEEITAAENEAYEWARAHPPH